MKRFKDTSRAIKENMVLTSKYEALFREDFTLITVELSGLVFPAELPFREHRSYPEIVFFLSALIAYNAMK